MPLHNPPAGGGHAITDEAGGALTSRPTLNFTGAGVQAVDDAGNTRTRVLVPGSSRFRAGRWYTAPGQRSTDLYAANGNGWYLPFWVGRQQSFDGIGLEVTVAGTTGALIRLGVYADDGNGWPDVLVVDAGTIDATVVAFSSITSGLGALTSLAADLYWLAAVAQGAPATLPTVRAISAGAHSWVGSAAPGASAYTVYTFSGVTGALGGTASAPTGTAGSGAASHLRAA